MPSLAAWEDVTKETVHNCFNKADFVHDDDDSIDWTILRQTFP